MLFFILITLLVLQTLTIVLTTLVTYKLAKVCRVPGSHYPIILTVGFTLLLISTIVSHIALATLLASRVAQATRVFHVLNDTASTLSLIAAALILSAYVISAFESKGYQATHQVLLALGVHAHYYGRHGERRPWPYLVSVYIKRLLTASLFLATAVLAALAWRETKNARTLATSIGYVMMALSEAFYAMFPHPTSVMAGTLARCVGLVLIYLAIR